MGCWGLGIMQSDDALDAQNEIFEAAGLSSQENKRSKIKISFVENFVEIEKVCEKYKDIDTYSSAVYWQVLAYESMKYGVQFNVEQQTKMVEGITSCNEYKQGKAYPNFEDLAKNIKEDYIKNFGEKDWLEREQVWGQNSLANRVVERTKNIEQLLVDLKNFINNEYKPFERKEPGLFETFENLSKKKKM